MKYRWKVLNNDRDKRYTVFAVRRQIVV